MMFGLRAPDRQPARRPVNIAPAKQQDLGGHTQPAVSGQRKHQPPLCVRAGIEYTLCIIPGDIVESLSVASHSGLEIVERILVDQPHAFGGVEEELGVAARLPNRVLSQPLLSKMQPPQVRITRSDAPKRRDGREVLHQMSPCSFVGQHGAGFDIRPTGDVPIDELCECCTGPRVDQAHTAQLVMHRVTELTHPLAGALRDRQAHGLCIGQFLDTQAKALGISLGHLAQVYGSALAFNEHLEFAAPGLSIN